MRCDNLGSPHWGQVTISGALSFQWALLLSRLALDVFFFGTAISTPPY